jgi:Bax protein
LIKSIAQDGTTGFQRFALGLMAGLVVVSAVAALVVPPGGTIRAPRASLEMLASIAIDSMPTMLVESVALPGVRHQGAGPTAAQVTEALSYDLVSVGGGSSDVPRVFLAAIPLDLSDVQETAERKALFFKSILPLILKVNEGLLVDRARLLAIQEIVRGKRKPGAVERLWLAMMSDRYSVSRDNIAALLQRVDIIPPSMAMAQAAAESGWGGSRFVREGNALFGQWTFAKGNLVPEDRADGKGHMVKRFNSLVDSVRAYARNLNTNRAYREYRALRADLRQKGKALDGRVLVGALHRYSERGVDYVNEIRSLISFNKLNRLDDARLANGLGRLPDRV